MDFQRQAIALFLYFLRCIGLLPFNFSLSTGHFQKSKLFLIYHIVMFFGFGVLVISEILLRTLWNQTLVSTDVIVSLLVTIASCATGLAIFFTVILNQEALLKILESTLIVSKTGLSISFWAWLFFSNCLIIILAVGTFILMEINAPELKFSITFQRIVSIMFYPTLQVFVNGFILFSGNLIRILSAVLKRNNSSLRKKYNAREFHLLLARHCHVVSMLEDINRVFGPGWLFIFLYNAVGLFYMSYHVTINAKAKYIDCIWICSYTWTTIYIVDATTYAANVAKRTGYIMLSTIYGFDDAVSKKAEAFCILQLHEGLHFDAYSFFEIDWKIVIAITGAVSTYTLIFLQLNLSGS